MSRAGTRAKPLPPVERRQAIVDATTPLLLEFGSAISTRQIAEAAGIAEGTIFRAFPDKESLLVAVVEHSVDRALTDDALRHIDGELGLAPRLEAAVAIIGSRVHDIFRLLAALDAVSPAARARLTRRSPDLTALTAVIEPDADLLGHSAERVARIVHGLTFTNTHPQFRDDPPLTPAEIVELVLNGALRSDRPC